LKRRRNKKKKRPLERKEKYRKLFSENKIRKKRIQKEKEERE
jgi:hypothetical protein